MVVGRGNDGDEVVVLIGRFTIIHKWTNGKDACVEFGHCPMIIRS